MIFHQLRLTHVNLQLEYLRLAECQVVFTVKVSELFRELHQEEENSMMVRNFYKSIIKYQVFILEPTCNPSCANGGSCIYHNMCQCPKNFRGPQCQYSVDRCSMRNTKFNGGFRCSGTETENTCTLNCPAGIDFEFPPAPAYKCKYETGVFTPSPMPNCAVGKFHKLQKIFLKINF